MMDKKSSAAYPINAIRICFDSYGTDACQGTIKGVGIEKDIPFASVSDLTVKIDDAYNEIGQPQQQHVLRSFGEVKPYNPYKGNPPRYHSSAEIRRQEGDHETVDLYMVSRHRAEWQGLLKNKSGVTIGKFNTIIECISLLKEVKAIAC